VGSQSTKRLHEAKLGVCFIKVWAAKNGLSEGSAAEAVEEAALELKSSKGKTNSIKGYLLREDFQRFWDYQRYDFAEKFLENWVTRTLQTDLEPMKKVARTLRKHKPLILNWFKARGEISSGAVEGMNLKVKLTMRKAYGFRTLKCLQIALYHELGKLPEPEYLHRFC